MSFKKNSSGLLKPFLIAEFPKDNPITCEAFLRTWLISYTQCYWPVNLKISQLQKIICDPNSKPGKDWKKCVCLILGERGKNFFNNSINIKYYIKLLILTSLFIDNFKKLNMTHNIIFSWFLFRYLY